MDQSSSAGPVGSASLPASAKSVVSNNSQAKSVVGSSEPWRSISISNRNHQVADLFGRCFLRVCYWVDVFSSFTRRDQPVPHAQLPKRAVESLQTSIPAAQLPESVSDQADSVLSTSPKTMEA
jgi:hypothetical protein